MYSCPPLTIPLPPVLLVADTKLQSASDTSDSDVEWEDVPGEEEDVPGEEEAPPLQQHGFTSHSFSVPIELTARVEVRETADNRSILDTLRDCRQQLMDHFFPVTARWLEV